MIRRFIFINIVALVCIVLLTSGVALAQNSAAEYVPLTGIKGITQESGAPIAGQGDLSSFFQNIFNLLIGVAGILAVIMLSWGGIEYMASDVITNKEEARKKMVGASLGLLLVLFSVAILYSINPDILSLRVLIPGIATESSGSNQTSTGDSRIERYNIAGDTASQNECRSKGGTVIPPGAHTDIWSCEITAQSAATGIAGIGKTFCPKSNLEISLFQEQCSAAGGQTNRKTNRSCFGAAEQICSKVVSISVPESSLSSYCSFQNELRGNNMYIIENDPKYKTFVELCSSNGATPRYYGSGIGVFDDCDDYADMFCQPAGSPRINVCVSADFRCPGYI